MAKKFTLVPSPTFKANVPIQIPGGKAAEVEFIFKHRDRAGFKEFVDSLEGKTDVEILTQIASGWDLEDAFDEENLELMTTNYLGSARAVLETYIAELTGARAKN